MTGRRIGVIGGIVLLGVMSWLAAAGVTALAEILITAVVLVVLIGGGNLLSGRRPVPAPRDASPPGPSGSRPAGGPMDADAGEP